MLEARPMGRNVACEDIDDGDEAVLQIRYRRCNCRLNRFGPIV